MKLSLVVPCYNEEKNVENFFGCCKKAFEDTIENYEIIFINDGSVDKTWSKLKFLASNHKEIKCINFSRNFGKESAMYAGLQYAQGEYISIIDADLQQRPETVLEMVKFLEENPDYDCVAAYQEKRIENKLLGVIKNAFYKIINMVSETAFVSGVSDFRTFRHAVVESILQMKEYHRFSKGIFSWVGYNVHYIPYVAEERFAGKTSWSVKKLLKYAIEGIVAFTVFPLKVSSIVGIITSVISFIYMIVVFIEKIFFGINISGYATITILILFLGGVQLIALGILGEYISKIYIQGKQRPIYIIKESINTLYK